MIHRISLALISLSLLLCVPACGDDSSSSGTDGGRPPADGSAGTDGGSDTDSGGDMDAGGGPTDGGPAVDGQTPGDGSTDDAMMMASGNSTLTPTCAPDDSPALSLIVAHGGTGCTIDTTMETVHISIWTNMITAPQTIMLDGTSGQAQICSADDGDGGSTCQPASSGTVTFDAFTEGTSASGSFSITVGTNTFNGTFAAVWCDATPMCG